MSSIPSFPSMTSISSLMSISFLDIITRNRYHLVYFA